MKTAFKKITSTLRRPRYGIPTAVFLLIIFIVIASAKGGNKPAYEVRTVSRGAVVQEVDATGNVKSAEAVDLAFEAGGKISNISVKVGDRVQAGQRLASLSNGDAAANLAAAEAKLLQLIKGSRSEDVAVSAASVSGAESDLSSAGAALADKVNDAFVKADDAIRNHADTLYQNPSTDPSFGVSVSSGGTTYYIGTSDTNMSVELSGGRENVEKILDEWVSITVGPNILADARKAESNLLTIQDLLNKIAVVINAHDSTSVTTSDVYASYKSEISTARTSASTALASLRTAIQTYVSAQSALDLSKKQQTLKLAPATSEEIAIQRAAVDAVAAAFNKTIINAPFSGLITRVTPSVGEIVSSQSPTISIISDSNLQIEVNIPESDLPRVKVGAVADVTFDAYDKDYVATTTVISIDPAATVIDGVPTYRTILAFGHNDPRIRSGLTANTTIKGERKENVIAIPQRAVVTKDGKKVVEVVVDGKITEKEVETGLRGTDGNIEILSGLSEGETYVPSPAAK